MNNVNPDHLNKIKAERQKVYGDPKENHEGIAQMWASILQPHWEAIRDQKPVPPHVVALLMSLLKINRMRLKFHEDNYVDVAVYLLEFAQDWQREHDGGGNVEVNVAKSASAMMTEYSAPVVDRHMALKNVALTRRQSEWRVCGPIGKTWTTPGVDVEATEPGAAALEYARDYLGATQNNAALTVFAPWPDQHRPQAWRVEVAHVSGNEWNVVSIRDIDPEALATLAKEVVQ